ncbi:hypothetical protein FB99_46460 (plasmid) [Pantoea agglomerans]|nr:hypothetical protein FB99_46460 [Pantoea agglomerans]
MPASALFCQHVLQHRFIEAQSGNQLLEAKVFLLDLLHMTDLLGLNATLFIAPRIECGIKMPAFGRHPARAPQLGMLMT